MILKNKQKSGFILLSIYLFTMILLSEVISNDNIEINEAILKLIAPEKFIANFETTKGSFEATIERKYSPLAVDRFYQLVISDYFSDIPIYRVIKNFVAQFGSIDGALDSAWSKHIILDEPVIFSNDTGTIAFARAGKNSRGTQLFINLKNNSRLDTVSYGETLGFPAFGYINKGMKIIYKLNDSYGDEPRLILDTLKNPKEYLKKHYPNLDYIISAKIIY